MGDWETVGSVDPARLADARLQLHWAAQAASAPGRQLLCHQPDFGEQSLQWLDGPAVLAQGLVSTARPFRSALRLSPPALLLLDEAGAALRELRLSGRTLDEIYGWLTAALEELLGRPLGQPLERPGEMPPHPVGHGRPFDAGDAAAFAEAGRWFAGGHRALWALAARETAASAVRCWPHHFDIATLVSLDGPGADDADGADAETDRSIGAGLSPGDSGRAEPYFYVTPWPYPRDRELPPLAGNGSWNTAGWVGALLPASAILGAAPGERQRQVEAFLDSAVAACHRLLEV